MGIQYASRSLSSMSSTHYDVIVIGGGASGMIAAGRAGERGKKVLLLEQNKTLGRKLAITGGGRCNVTNAEMDTGTLLKHYGEAEPFLYSAFSQFGVKDTFSFFESRNLPLIVEARKRAFPETQKAEDVVRTLKEYVRASGVEVRTNEGVTEIISEHERVTGVRTKNGEYRTDAVILATGGVSHPETGSTGDGFEWLRKLGHTVVESTPTIVPLKVSDAWVGRLAGKKIPDAKIIFFVNDERRFSVRGDVLVTHFGLSGPTILNAAWQVAELLEEGEVSARIDTKPDFDTGILDAEVTRIFDVHKNKAVKNALSDIAPPGSTETLLSLLSDIDAEKKVHSVTKEERRRIVDLLKGVPVHIEGLMGFDRAVVADGGVPLIEIDTKTMCSRKIQNLYIVGDLLHINRPSGGYSLQLCWTTGYVAGSFT